MNNSILMKLYPRQPNTLARVRDNRGEEQIFDHATTQMGLFACGGAIVLEIMIFNAPDATEPVKVVALPNPLAIEIEGAMK